jgi:DNA-binding NarL/FixJ family response regulator
MSSELTERHVAVLQMVADGKSIAETAEALCLEYGTAKNLLVTIYRHLEVCNLPHAIAVAMRKGLIT